MTIDMAKWRHNGTVICVATNRAGSVASKASLLVQGKKPLPSPSLLSSKVPNGILA